MFLLLFYSAIRFVILFIKYNLKFIDYNTYVKNTCFILSDLNVYYIKIFQWQLVDQTNVELQEFFKDYTNNVKYTDKDIDLNSLYDLIEFSKKNNNNLSIDSYKPVNSGTISLVFKGKLNDNPIAIKMLRHNIKNDILDCLKITNYFIKIINNLNKLTWIFNYKINFNNIIENIETCLIDQCDFNKEVKNLELFYENYKNSKDIVIPRVFKEYTNNNDKLIVMDFLDGKNLHDLNQYEIDIYSKIFNKYIINSLLYKRLFNTDFHSGNIIFMNQNNKYSMGIIDFGLIKKLNNYEYSLMNSVFYALIEENYLNLFKTITTKCVVTNNKDLHKKIIDILLDNKNKNKILINGYLDKKDFEIILKIAYENIDKESSIKKENFELLLGLISNLNVLQILTKNTPLHKIYKKYLVPEKLAI